MEFEIGEVETRMRAGACHAKRSVKMKEVTYKDWQKNPTPREMWVWDDYVEDKKKMKVLYISKEAYPIVSVTSNGKHVYRYEHCAEIEKRRMTKKELSRWLREKPTREYKYKNVDDYVYSYYAYKESHADKEIDDRFLIREDDGEWREPLVEVEE